MVIFDEYDYLDEYVDNLEDNPYRLSVEEAESLLGNEIDLGVNYE